MRLISAGSLVRAQSGPFSFHITSFNALSYSVRQRESASGDSRNNLPPVLDRQNNGYDSILGTMKNSILSATFCCAIFVNAAATFAGQWTEVPGGAAPHSSQLYGVAVVSASDIWAVGSWGGGNGLIEHWDGTNWSVVNGPPANGSALFSLKAFATNDVWAVGYKDYDYNQNTSSTFTLHWDGTAWSEIPSPNVIDTGSLRGVDGAAPNDVWA